MLEQYAAAKQQQQQAYECCSSHVLLQCRWVLLLLLLLSARVPATAWPRRGPVYLVLSALVQSSDRGHGSSFLRYNRPETYSGSCAEVLLVRSSPARAVRTSNRTARTSVQLLLESSVARGLLDVVAAAAAAAAAECSSALLRTQDVRTRLINQVDNASVGGPSLTTYTNHTRCETPCTAVCPNDAAAVH